MGWAVSPRGKVRHRVDDGELHTACGRLAAGWRALGIGEDMAVCEVCAAVAPPPAPEPDDDVVVQRATGDPVDAVAEVVVLLQRDDGTVPAHVRPLETVALGIAADIHRSKDPSAALWKQFREALADLVAKIPAGDAEADLVNELVGDDAPEAS